MYDKDIENIIVKMSIFEKAFDSIRLIDPVKRNVLNLKEDLVIDTNTNCFESWDKKTVCENCVAMRAFRDNDTFVKIDYSSEEIYIVTAIPVEIGDRVIVMELIKKATNSITFGSDQKELSADIHSMIDKLNNIALKDSLTGIYNRRYINERLPVDLLNEELSGQSISVIMADLDLFKNVNDNYGHLAGDYTLANFAKLLHQELKRENDWVARYGGEEFLVCMPGANLQLAKDTAERMRKALEEKEMEFGDYKFKITASFGVYSVAPGMNASMDEVVEHADKMLYFAKRNGRNRVEG